MIYIALLRGINVGGHNIVKMAELKRMFESMGYGKVKTYIQSGNVLFESDEKAEPLRAAIEREIHATFGLAVTVVLRTDAELERIMKQCPFDPDALAEGESLYVAMLAGAPSQEGIEKLAASDNQNDEFRIVGSDVYLLLRGGAQNAKLAVNLQKLGVAATMRNWNTMNKLTAMAQAL